MEQEGDSKIELTDEKAEEIKQRLLTQLGNFPEDQREQIREQVLSMTTEEVEEFIEKNQLDHLSPNQKCIFCSIIEGKVPSYKIAEDHENIAILEINPLTKAHTLIVPKEHKDKLSQSTLDFAKKVSETINRNLNPIKIQATENKIMNHAIIELVPVYENETPRERKTASETDLKKLQETLTKPAPIKEKEEKIQTNEIHKPIEIKEEKRELPKLKPRIP